MVIILIKLELLHLCYYVKYTNTSRNSAEKYANMLIL